ncbi:MAG: type II toxin-antitoxin system VapC family toxin [bacterium]|nr:type II toxin-antitoxin system VapC family toxin [bacterium]
MTRSPRLLLDTHIWYWYVAGSRDLPTPLRDAIDEALGSCWLSPISLWELGVLVDKQRIRIDLPYQKWVDRALTDFPVHEAAVNFEVSRRVKDLAGLHADPADRFLAATALIYELTLVTLDGRLVTTDWLSTLTV